MPFAPRIRRVILNALDCHIIPALRMQNVPLGYVASPLVFPEGIEVNLVDTEVPEQGEVLPSFINNADWPEAKLHSTLHPYLSFIYKGRATEHTIIHAESLGEFSCKPGIYVLRAPAPSVLFFPSGAPRNSGKIRFLEAAQVLQIGLCEPILIHTHIETSSFHEVSHSLQVNDSALVMLATLMAEEMQSTAQSQQETAQAALLTFMLRLRHLLLFSPPRLANTSIPPSPNLTSASYQKESVYQKALYFIHTHLHEPLSVSRIATEMGISPAQLNRYFRKHAGTSTMKYAQKQRIEAAKLILERGSENIEEIAHLLGYRYSTAFRATFRKETGMSPLQFRKKMRE